MRNWLIMFLKTHPKLTLMSYSLMRYVMKFWSLFVPVQEKTILFNSFGGRGFNDSPKALYDEICRREEFMDWRLIWAFVDPSKHDVPRGEKVKIDTYSFFKALLYSRVWIGNSGVSRGIEPRLKHHVCIETWHGTPLKKICGEENTETFAERPENYKGPIDNTTIRCAQSDFDREIFARVFHAAKESIIPSDLPRNDKLLNYSKPELDEIKKSLDIDDKKKVILYAPTYREYLINKNNENYIAPPININKWRERLGKQYVLLVRAHYEVSASLGITNDDFVKDVSRYSSVNDLYAISDMMVSDYSSAYFDYAILDRPILCFAYDQKEYEEKRGLYLNLAEALPCEVIDNEDDLINAILRIDYRAASAKTRKFHEKFAPNAGHASQTVVDLMLTRL